MKLTESELAISKSVKKRAKAQGDIVSAVIILLMAISLVSVAYTWGVPLIEKQQSQSMLNRLNSYFDSTREISLPKKIERVANNGGEEIFSSEINGVWTLYEDDESIEFETFSKITEVAANDEWIGKDCKADGSPPDSGILGEDSSSVICRKAVTFANAYKLFYRIWYRDLVSSSTGKIFRIDIQMHPSSAASSTSNIVRVSQGQPSSSPTLLTTPVRVILG